MKIIKTLVLLALLGASLVVFAEEVAMELEPIALEPEAGLENQPPVLEDIPNYTIETGETLEFQAVATDVDGPRPTPLFSMNVNVAGASMTDEGFFSWTPTEEQGPGVYHFVVIVSDGRNGQDNDIFTVTVREVISPSVTIEPTTIEPIDESDPAPEPEPEPEPQATSGGGSSGGRSGRRAAAPAPSGQVLGASLTCAPYLTTYLRLGSNNTSEVIKLQSFLNEYLGAGLPLTGFFGPLTESAVNQFQLANKASVLRPWLAFGLANEDTPTGYVYKTTLTQINNLICPSLALAVPQLP